MTLRGGQVEVFWDEVLPIHARELPDDLAGLDRVLRDPVLLRPVHAAWACSARDRGRPSVAIDVFVRLMVVKQRTRWGYETLVREVSDSLHLRRFCLIALDQRVPDESTVRKLARPPWAGRRRRDHAARDRPGAARGALSRARRKDRLDGGRGRHSLCTGGWRARTQRPTNATSRCP